MAGVGEAEVWEAAGHMIGLGHHCADFAFKSQVELRESSDRRVQTSGVHRLPLAVGGEQTAGEQGWEQGDLGGVLL